MKTHKLTAIFNILMFYIQFMGPFVLRRQAPSLPVIRNLRDRTLWRWTKKIGQIVVGVAVISLGVAWMGFLINNAPVCRMCYKTYSRALVLGVIVIGLGVLLIGEAIVDWRDDKTIWDIFDRRRLSQAEVELAQEKEVYEKKQLGKMVGLWAHKNIKDELWAQGKKNQPQKLSFGQKFKKFMNYAYQNVVHGKAGGPPPPRRTPNEVKKEVRRIANEGHKDIADFEEKYLRMWNDSLGKEYAEFYKSMRKLRKEFHYNRIDRIVFFTVGNQHRTRQYEASLDGIYERHKAEIDPIFEKLYQAKKKPTADEEKELLGQYMAIIYSDAPQKMTHELKARAGAELMTQFIDNGATKHDMRKPRFRGAAKACLYFLINLEDQRAAAFAQDPDLSEKEKEQAKRVSAELQKAKKVIMKGDPKLEKQVQEEEQKRVA